MSSTPSVVAQLKRITLLKPNTGIVFNQCNSIRVMRYGCTHSTASDFSLYNNICGHDLTTFCFLSSNLLGSNSVFGDLEAASSPAGVRVGLGGL